MYLFQGLVYAFLCQPALVTLALSVNLSDGAAGGPECPLHPAADTEHPCFSYVATKFSPIWPRLLYLDAVSFGAPPQSHYQVAYGEELVVRL